MVNLTKTWCGKKMKAVAAALMLTLAMGAMGCGGSGGSGAEKDGKQVHVGIVQLVEHKALDDANRGFVDGLAKKGFVEGKNITFDRQNAQADQSNLQNIAQRFVNGKVDLICAIATPAAQTMANATRDIPIVATAVTDYEAARLVKSAEKPGRNVTGTTDMNPIPQQAEMMLKIMPQLKTVGIIYCSSEVNSQLQVERMTKELEKRGVQVKLATVSNVNDIQQAAHSIVGQVQALYTPTDNVIASALPNLCRITDEAKIPVFCGEGNHVPSGGIIAVGIDYYKLGEQTGEMAGDILSGKSKPQDMAIQSQKDFEVVYNPKQAEKMGVTVPAELVKNAIIIK